MAACTTPMNVSTGSVVQAGVGPRSLRFHEAVKAQAERYIRMYISMLTGDSSGRRSTNMGRLSMPSRRVGPKQRKRAVETNWSHAADRLGKVIEVVGERGSCRNLLA